MTSPRFSTPEHPPAAPTPHMASYDPERTVALGDRPIPPADPDGLAAPRPPWPNPAVPTPTPPWPHPGPPPTPQDPTPGWTTPRSADAWGYPPHDPIQHTPAARRGRRKTLVLAAIATIVLLIVIAVVISTVGKDGATTAASAAHSAAESASTEPTNPPSATPPPTVPITALGGLLLNADEIDVAAGWPTAQVTEPDKTFQTLTSTRSGEKCQSAISVVSSDTFLGSGYTSVRSQRVVGGSPPDPQDWILINGVAAFQSAARATTTVEKAKQSWQDCANQTVKTRKTTEDGGYDVYWAIGSLTIDDGVLFIPSIQEGADGWTCWRALGAHNNIAIDVVTCATGATKDNAQGAYNAIAAKVDAAA